MRDPTDWHSELDGEAKVSVTELGLATALYQALLEDPGFDGSKGWVEGIAIKTFQMLEASGACHLMPEPTDEQLEAACVGWYGSRDRWTGYASPAMRDTCRRKMRAALVAYEAVREKLPPYSFAPSRPPLPQASDRDPKGSQAEQG